MKKVLRAEGGHPGKYSPSPARLSLADREEIRAGLERGESLRAIATMVGRAASTVSREVKANGGRDRYRAWQAHRLAGEKARRPKAGLLKTRPDLAGVVYASLYGFWSPQKIARALRKVFADVPMMWVSHETIYRTIYVQGRGELRRELARCLRSGRAQRKARVTGAHRGKIPDMVMIADRPAEVADRAVPGHWEGDLIIGSGGASAVGTLVERTTRYVMLLHLPDDHTAEAVRDAIALEVGRLPPHLVKSITWDQGRELAQHKALTAETGVDVYFCDPHSPWQRGSNENTNGLLRQYMPKSTDLSKYSRKDLDDICYSLNWRPRETLDDKTPMEAFAALVATTA